MMQRPVSVRPEECAAAPPVRPEERAAAPPVRPEERAKRASRRGEGLSFETHATRAPQDERKRDRPEDEASIKEQINNTFASEYKILFIEPSQKNASLKAYAIDKKSKLGSGGYGVVYAAYPIDIENMTLDKSIKLAVKIFKDTTTFQFKEAEFFKRYYKICDIGFLDDDVCQVMDYLPGVNLYSLDRNCNPQLSSSISSLNFSQRIALIQSITMFVNIMHHATPSTGCSLIHSDLNGANIRANIDETTNMFDAFLLDFALATEVDDNPDKINDNQSMEGSLYYMSIEIIKENKGIKTDIYALAAIFIILLGAKHPFSYKQQHSIAKEDFFEAGFCFDGIFSSMDLPTYRPDVLPYVLIFLYRMQSNNYNERPDSDSVLRFFTTLNNFCKTYDTDRKDDSNLVRGAILALLASGLWKVTCEKVGDEPFSFTFDQLNLHKHISFCRDVIAYTRNRSYKWSDIIAEDKINDNILSLESFESLLAKYSVGIDGAKFQSELTFSADAVPQNVITNATNATLFGSVETQQTEETRSLLRSP